ncbi:MAG: ComF family protein [Clostridium sp.]|uniref:ComF family protein n=1 Tax=Clostridium sp. TaxID=1506 RepID=UPI003F3C675A
MGRKLFKNLIDGILDVIFPVENKCVVCNEEDEEGLCDKCKRKIVLCEKNDNSYAYYNETLKKLILSFKFSKNFTSGDILSKFLIQKLENEDKDCIITYVPLSKKRLKKRGFNQCEYLARKVGEALNIEVLDTLEQVEEIREQKTLGVKERRENVKNAFVCKNSKIIKKKKIILIDDVITTGATIRECEKILKNNDVLSIKVLTIGKSDI